MNEGGVSVICDIIIIHTVTVKKEQKRETVKMNKGSATDYNWPAQSKRENENKICQKSKGNETVWKSRYQGKERIGKMQEKSSK